MKQARKWRWQDALGWLALATLILATAAHLLTRPPAMPEYETVRADWKPSEAWLYDRDGRLLDSERVDFERRRLAWVPLKDISPDVRDMVVAAEDHRFWSHGGVDWLAMASAIRTRWTGGRSRGASTLPMQLAAFLAPELARPGQRGWLAKIRQMRAAQDLASNWTHEQMLEAYFNLLPLRGEAQGIGAGAQSLFGKTPAEMNRTDAALFAGLLPNPAARAEALGKRACRIAKAADCGAIDAAAATLASGERATRFDPGLAPHLAARLLDKPGKRVTTTIDRRIQTAAIVALRRQLAGLGSDRVRDGAVVVLDNATGDVLAYVGGVGLKSTAAAVDGANAPRQAGSTLKPHLYAQVIEHGWLTAASILDDSPVQLDTASGLYVPKNYDHSFKGPVSVRHALASSLNVPAVRALVIDDVQEFRDRLWALGYHSLVEDGEYYGFSLALGSAEVSLVEQANAFRTLANQGRWSPVRFREGEKPQESRRIVSAPAAFIVGDILADASARADAFGADSALRLPFWAAAKTGTSKGMRDNWCIGFTDRYTVAVWVGNLEGDSMRAVSGTSGAAPVWRDVMLALHASSPGKAPAMPAGVEVRQISLPGTREPPRREYFLTGTAQSELAAAPQAARRPRITSPVSGSVYALDPDIPLDRQRLAVIVSGDVPGYRLILDKQVLGDADAGQQILPRPGSHMLTLVDPGGKPIDRVRFTVR
ncbi:penicillin-binding protein 1C [Sphingopyxis sp. H071]|nr:penicillin-binding protein 1C [Sphingopyxis sp. H057]KTE50850.1 penicillin-binding protein 1C [Sphingopyxis sp. H073]KTE51830.1 penicillin-binding protein 1C [Sphingopyxis sp. H071]KTE56589.1 penicillin-binding protein 1C [Sphingopyxis sp. H107]KTE64395.1 penicillin-binding protein 1C [Sphingopyxis sp. H100]KTE73032.1 penicillin-binding protein 1C [Sphingopyxis sp. H081]KTE79427.1 penicillin-binding protein 1C [Sphingopyxis sp. H067]